LVRDTTASVFLGNALGRKHQTYGLLDDRLIMLVWTERGDTRHVISMRKCNAREKAFFQARLV